MATKPTKVGVYSPASNWTSAVGGTTRTTSSFSVLAGDRLVVFAGSEDQTNVALPTIAGGSLTWAAEVNDTTASNAVSRIWSATVSSPGSITVAVTRNAGSPGRFGFDVQHFRDSDGFGAKGSARATGAPSGTFNTTQDNSAIVVGSADWAAIAGGSRVWRTVNGITPTSGNGLETGYFTDSGQYTVYSGYYDDAGTAGSKTVGLSAPTGQTYKLSYLEVLGTAGGGGSYTLDASADSYAIGGTAATLKYTRKVAANSGSYAISGTAATLRRGFKLAADSSSYAVSGTAVTFARSRNIVANSGTYSVAGTAANLEAHRRLVAASAAYAISGTAATLSASKRVVASTGSYSISGANAGLLVARKLALSGSTYSINGTDATLSKTSDKVVLVDTGIYAIDGTEARLAYSHRIMVAQSATYQIGGYPVTLFKGMPIPRNSLNAKIKFGGAGSMGDLARMGADIELISIATRRSRNMARTSGAITPSRAGTSLNDT